MSNLEMWFWIIFWVGLVISIIISGIGIIEAEFEIALFALIFAFISFVVYHAMENYSITRTPKVELSREHLEILDMDLIDDVMRFDYRDHDDGVAKTIKFDTISDFHKYQKGGKLTKVKSVKYSNFGSDRYYSNVIIDVED